MYEAEASKLILRMVGNHHEVEKCDSNCWKNEKIALPQTNEDNCEGKQCRGGNLPKTNEVGKL